MTERLDWPFGWVVWLGHAVLRPLLRGHNELVSLVGQYLNLSRLPWSHGELLLEEQDTPKGLMLLYLFNFPFIEALYQRAITCHAHVLMSQLLRHGPFDWSLKLHPPEAYLPELWLHVPRSVRVWPLLRQLLKSAQVSIEWKQAILQRAILRERTAHFYLSVMEALQEDVLKFWWWFQVMVPRNQIVCLWAHSEIKDWLARHRADYSPLWSSLIEDLWHWTYRQSCGISMWRLMLAIPSQCWSEWPLFIYPPRQHCLRCLYDPFCCRLCALHVVQRLAVWLQLYQEQNPAAYSCVHYTWDTLTCTASDLCYLLQVWTDCAQPQSMADCTPRLSSLLYALDHKWLTWVGDTEPPFPLHVADLSHFSRVVEQVKSLATPPKELSLDLRDFPALPRRKRPSRPAVSTQKPSRPAPRSPVRILRRPERLPQVSKASGGEEITKKTTNVAEDYRNQ